MSYPQFGYTYSSAPQVKRPREAGRTGRQGPGDPVSLPAVRACATLRGKGGAAEKYRREKGGACA